MAGRRIAIQAYLKACRGKKRDLATVAGWVRVAARPVWVRSSRERNWDYETVIQHRRIGRCRYSGEMADRRLLRAHDAVLPRTTPGCGRSSAATTSAASTMRLPRSAAGGGPTTATRYRCSTGLADPIKDALRSGAARPRLHALWPAAAGMAYLVAGCCENTANTSSLRASSARSARRKC